MRTIDIGGWLFFACAGTGGGGKKDREPLNYHVSIIVSDHITVYPSMNVST